MPQSNINKANNQQIDFFQFSMCKLAENFHLIERMRKSHTKHTELRGPPVATHPGTTSSYSSIYAVNVSHRNPKVDIFVSNKFG